MARFAQIVALGCPHHVTARGARREPILFEDGDQDIYCDILAEPMRKASVAELLPDAKPRPPHSLSRNRRRLGSGARRRAPALGQLCQYAGSKARPCVRQPVRIGGDGRRASDGGRDIRRDDSGPRAPGRTGGRLALVERWRSRRPSPGQVLAGMDDGLVTVAPIFRAGRLVRGARRGRCRTSRLRRDRRRRDDGPPARRRGFRRRSRTRPRSADRATVAGPQARSGGARDAAVAVAAETGGYGAPVPVFTAP